MSKDRINKRLEKIFADLQAGSENDLASYLAGDTHSYYWEADQNGLYTVCDENIRNGLGLAPQDLIGNPLLSFRVPEEDQKKLRESIEPGHYPLEVTTHLIDSKNQPRGVRLSVFKKFDTAGNTTGLRGYAEILEPAEKKEIPVKKTAPKKTPGSSSKKKGSGTLELEAQTKELIAADQGTAPLADVELKIPEPPDKPRRQRKRATGFSMAGKAEGTAKLAITDSLTIPMSETESVSQNRASANRFDQLAGMALINERFENAATVWTAQAQEGFDEDQQVSIPSLDSKPAILAQPIHLRNEKNGLIEIIDDRPGRVWTAEEKRLIQEVAHHLGLALENSQLYSTIQRELSERVKAEREALRRNKDLANLNHISQQLTQLASRQQIFDTVAEMTQKIMGVENVLLGLYDAAENSLSFPICLVNGLHINLSPRPAATGYQEEILQDPKPLLLNRNVAAHLKEKKLDHSDYMPYSLLAVPLMTGDHTTGVLSVYDFQNEDAFDQIHVELLSSIAAQLATALENTKLFNDVNRALNQIENRQRIQNYVTNAVADLSLKGSKNIKAFLSALAEATRGERIYYAEGQTNPEGEFFWRAVEVWHAEDTGAVFDDQPIDTVRFEDHPQRIADISAKGWHAATLATAEGEEKKFMSAQGVQSLLLLGVKPENAPIGFLSIEHFTTEKDWEQEEIDILRTAADAFTNTLIRENLLNQLQTNLTETESLYSASHQMALANHIEEMILAVLSNVKESPLEKGEVLLFDFNLDGRISQITPSASYSSAGNGINQTREYKEPLSAWAEFFSTAKPVYYDDLEKADLPDDLLKTFQQASVRSLAVLPLWSSNVQIGVLLLESTQVHYFTQSEKRGFPPLVDQMSTAIQNQRLFESTQIALAETELLYRITNGIANSKGTDELVNLVGENSLPLNCEMVSLYLVDEPNEADNPDFRLAGTYTKSGEPIQTQPKVPGAALDFVQFQSREPTILECDESDALPPAALSFLNKTGLCSLIVVPLHTATNPVGFFLTGSRSAIQIDEKDAHTLQIIGNSVAVAIEKHRLLFEAQRRALELQTAAEIARDTTSTLSQDILLSRIVKLLKDRFGFYHCSIFLLDETNQYAVVKESTGEAGTLMKKNHYRLAIGSKSVIGSCIASGHAVIVNDSNLSPVFYPNPLLPETRSELGIPLKIGGRIIGALDLHSSSVNSFSANELTVLQILTDQITVAIENARAFSLAQKAVQEMKELDRVKSQFLANMSHELRTPLNSVIGFSRVILKGIDGPINEVQKQDITSIYNSGMNLLNMINEILDLSKIEAGKMELQLEDISIGDVIQKAVTTATGLIMDKPIQLVKKIPPDLPLARGDEIKIGQVVLNLLSNAIKFTEQGTVEVEAEIVQRETLRPHIRVLVRDSGVGIAKADQPKLFQRFSQVDDSPTRKTGGTGLGLSISRSLVEMHGGKIGLLSSEPGKGSVFYFTLPVADNQKGLEISRLGYGKNVILAIDDDPQVIALYERYLKNYGFEVVSLTNPGDAVQKALELQPFAITLDIMMPQVDGWHVLNELKQDERTRDIPILVCSIVEDEEKGYNLGASEYLVKPFLQDDLINAIHRISRSGQTLEVLIIDDDSEDLKLVKKMVEAEEKFHPILAQGGRAALDILKYTMPDLIILDLFMPDMNGFELLDRFKTDPKLSKVPVIVLTGTDLSEEQKKVLVESSRSLAHNSLLAESDILKNMEEALEKIRQKK